MSDSGRENAYGLVLGEYCAEDSTYSAQGRLPAPPDLEALRERAAAIWGKALLLKRLDALVITAGKATVHVYGDGRIVLTGVRDLNDASSLLHQLKGRS